MKRSSRSNRGTTPFQFTLLLMVILVTVSFIGVLAFQGLLNNHSESFLNIENINFYNDVSTDYVEITISNSGASDTKVESVYIGNSVSFLALQNNVAYNPHNQILSSGSSLKITFNFDWTSGETYRFKITTESGQRLYFNRECEVK